MFCAISGVPPEEPVVNVKTGSIYEKRLILQHLVSSGGRDPENGEPLGESDLLPLKTSGGVVRPQNPTTTSIPGALLHMRNEWDAVMLEMFRLKENLKSTRQELSQSLYHYDAALRVIARLVKERDEARNALSELRNRGTLAPKVNDGEAREVANGRPAEDSAMDVVDSAEGMELPPEVIATIDEKAKELQGWRKKRPSVPSLPKPTTVGAYQGEKQVSLGAMTPRTLRVSAAEPVHEKDGEPLLPTVAIGGDNGVIAVFHGDLSAPLEELVGFNDEVCALAVDTRMSSIVGGSADSTVKLWSAGADGKYVEKGTLRPHKKVRACSYHPTNSYFSTCSTDATWALHDADVLKTLTKVLDPDEAPIVSGEFHPDGLIFATGLENGKLRVWDVKMRQTAATFDTETSGCGSLAFSENGYYLVSVSGGNNVKLWDLRKQTAVKSVQLEDDAEVLQASIDFSGSYLALAGKHGLQLRDVKKWRELSTISTEAAALCCGWERTAQVLVAGSSDHSVVFYSK